MLTNLTSPLALTSPLFDKPGSLGCEALEHEHGHWPCRSVETASAWDRAQGESERDHDGAEYTDRCKAHRFDRSAGHALSSLMLFGWDDGGRQHRRSRAA